jgi:sugar O-acyltransferase (sialic acid O-acetyltransferase NeuD family)
MKKIMMVGAGGHASSCLEIIKAEKKLRVVGFFDKSKDQFHNFKFLGSDREIHKYVNKYKNLHISFANLQNLYERKKIFEKAKKLGFCFPVIISPYSVISKLSKIDEGTIIFHNCVINYNASIGKNTIINNNCIIEHDVVIGNNCHVAPGSILNGNVIIEDNVFIGSGSVIKENVVIKKNTIIGMATKVLKTPSKKIYYNKMEILK